MINQGNEMKNLKITDLEHRETINTLRYLSPEGDHGISVHQFERLDNDIRLALIRNKIASLEEFTSRRVTELTELKNYLIAAEKKQQKETK